MLNLFEMKEKTIDIVWTDGKLMKIEQPTIKLLTEVSEADDIKAQCEYMAKILNRNKSAIKVEVQEVNNLTKSAFEALVNEILNYKEKVDNSKNV